MTVPFNSRKEEYKTPFGAVASGTEVTFRLIFERGSEPFRAVFYYHNDSEMTVSKEMEKEEYGEKAAFTIKVAFGTGLWFYRFGCDFGLGETGVLNAGSGIGAAGTVGTEWQQTVYDADYETPDGLTGGVIYQIFPDRFFPSGKDKENVPDDRFLRTDWGGEPEYRQLKGEKCSLGNDYFGGDIKGITEKLGYISSLGVTVIYLNPIFEAHSNHRYNTADYMKIDPLLGTEDDFKELCLEAEKYGIRIILDGVFSHTGDDSIYFDRYGRYESGGAFGDRYSRYAGWYKFYRWPDGYSAWWGVPSLPETKEENPDFSEYITGENGVLKKWLRLGAGGYRLDVADELPDVFLDKLRASVKSENADAVIIGEVWEDATNKISYGERRRYLLGKQLDSVMNYPFKDAIIGFVRGKNAEDLAETVLSVCENYPKKSLDILMNHIGTHDTERILTALGGEPTDGRDRAWQSGRKMNEGERYIAEKRLYVAALLQYTLPGIPSVFYGDEAGVEGYGDPFCRSCYPWGNENGYLLEYYKKLGKLRKICPALKTGKFVLQYASLGSFAFLRESDEETLFVAVNRWYDGVTVPFPDGYKVKEAVFGYMPENGSVKVDGYGFTVLRLIKE